MTLRRRTMLSRRTFLGRLPAAAALTTGGGLFMPALSRAGDRPLLTHGLQSGDVSASSGVVWARADRPSRVQIEVATTDSFKDVVRKVWVDALPESDLTAKLAVDGLPAGQDIFYRVTLQDHAEPTVLGEPSVGRFRTAPADKRDVAFVWSGDTSGQGWGIDEARGGMKTYATMLKHRPDFFIHSGDTIYADGPIPAEIKLPNGELWKNITIEEKAKPAETLAEFRGNYKYNLLDKNLREFNAAVPMLTQWDDHEVTNNWWPEEPLTRPEHARKKYVEKNMMVMVARAARAFHEYMPVRLEPTEPGRVYRKISYGPLLDVFMLDMRSYRGPNGENRQTTYGPDAYFLGPTQVAWLKRELKASQATWKVMGRTCRSASTSCTTATANSAARPLPRATTACRSAASWRSRISWASSSARRYATRCGSQPTCTTPPPTTTTPTRPSSRTSTRSGSSSPVPSMRARSVPMISTVHSGRSSCT
jgi:alkaline phosphatase D